jgi:hypothetical protein
VDEIERRISRTYRILSLLTVAVTTYLFGYGMGVYYSHRDQPVPVPYLVTCPRSSVGGTTPLVPTTLTHPI